VINPPFFAVLLIVVILCGIILGKYLKAAREIKLTSALKTSPFYAVFSEIVVGVGIIRAYGQQKLFDKIAANRADSYHRCVYNGDSCLKWISIRAEACMVLLLW
jgi:hypothetical protein